MLQDNDLYIRNKWKIESIQELKKCLNSLEKSISMVAYDYEPDLIIYIKQIKAIKSEINNLINKKLSKKISKIEDLINIRNNKNELNI